MKSRPRLTACAVGLLGLLPAAAVTPATRDDTERRLRIAAMVEAVRRAFPAVAGLDAAGLEVLAAAGRVVLVDVREPAERAVSLLPGAISREAFEARRESYRGAAIVAYCTIGHRSGRYADALRRQGFRAFNLEGSILAWTHAGRPLVTPTGEPTRRLHVYGPAWDLAASGYEAVW